MSRYYGIMEGFTLFLKELSHPYKNWRFIVKETRGYSLDYFHLLKNHPDGAAGAALFIEIFFDAIANTSSKGVRAEAIDNLLLFLQKIITDSKETFGKFQPVLNNTFDLIREQNTEIFTEFMMSYYQMKKLAQVLIKSCDESVGNLRPLNNLLVEYYKKTYEYWLNESDPQEWFETSSGVKDYHDKIKPFFSEISHTEINKWNNTLSELAASEDSDSLGDLKKIVKLPGYNQIAGAYRAIPQALFDIGSPHGHGNRWKLLFIFHIMNISGLSMIHEETLRDINRTLTWLIGHENYKYVQKLIKQTFEILKARTKRFPATALSCMLNMGKGVYETDETSLVNYFVESMVDLGFQQPKIGGVGNDWQIKVNRAHIKNIRTWLEVIELNPKWSSKLLSALIIHLSLYGVFIKDTDLFPRDITRLLNSYIEPVYNLAKQLARLFPTYFNDIGAEGQLRDISTELDEMCNRRDVLIHFLRKQSHVESSNRIIGFIESIFEFWMTKKKEVLFSYIPPSIYDQIEEMGEYVDGMSRVIHQIEARGVSIPKGLLTTSDKRINEITADVKKATADDIKRIGLTISLYKLLNQKYNLDFIEIDKCLTQLKVDAFPGLDELKTALAEPKRKQKISSLLDYLESLKALILSDEVYDVREDIYKKRHFTVDIPSMYGSYHEMKFDALGLTFRIESLINVLFEEIIEDIDLTLITKDTFFKIHERLRLFEKALKLDGISSAELEVQLNLFTHALEVRGFSFTQYLDIFKGFAHAVKNIINDYFNNVHEENLSKILDQVSYDQVQPKYLPNEELKDHVKLKHRVSEVFSRERIALSLGLPQLDRFLGRILNTLFHQADKLHKDKLHLLLNYDPHRAIASIDQEPEARTSDLIYLGNKGFNMLRLKSFGLPVPPAFIITTEVFRCREIIDSYRPAEKNFKEQVAQGVAEVENKTGASFGDPENPLLFSVRSGSSISQPGMMDTFLNVGINEEVAAGLGKISDNEWFGWDSYRRFLQGYGMSFGLERNDFDAVIGDFKKELGTPYKRDFSGDQMKMVSLAYKKYILDSGIAIPDDPYEQLHMSIKRVFESWYSSKAKTYRKIMGISDDWGTAVTVQKMVFGNISEYSGTGVVFTHNPRWSGDILKLWGDFSIENQGEDVVSGLVETLPISNIQQEIELRETYITLELRFPEIYQKLKEWANFLIDDQEWSPQEMEFTFEGPSADQLYILQTRDMAMRERKSECTFDIEGVDEKRHLGHGIGVSGGAMSGRLVFTLEEIDMWQEKEPETPLILARADTVPDDIREIYAADGLLTARGGLTSHAAVVAHRLEKTCVVGCASMVCNEKDKTCLFNEIHIKSGEHISIDGQEGSVYQGLLKVKESS
ncbi:MAG: pyruvate, phosphate dikinase [Desulfobacterales bacterium]|nr:pyruvate, phosphate dikinase [Desulfobacterales bacterium]